MKSRVVTGLLLGAVALAAGLYVALPLVSDIEDGTAPVAAAGGARGGGGRRGGGATLVVTQRVESALAGDRLTALGDGEAAVSVTVTPRESGLLAELDVASGQQVARGDVLARLDTELEAVAVEIAERAVADATTARDRLARLMRSSAGAQIDLDDAENALARAQLTLRDAALKLSRRTVLAPIDGRVGIVRVDVGDRVQSDTEIVTIDDRSTLLIDFRVPERFAARLRIDQPIEATTFAANAELQGRIQAIGSRVDPASRTLPVRAAIDNADDRLRPGMSFSVAVRFEGETWPAVDPLAVQWDSQGSYVWKIAAGRAERTPVRIVQRNPENVLVQAQLSPGDEVVTEGVLSLREGADVRVAGARSGGSDPAGGAETGDGDTARPARSGT